jgi:NAD(P)H-hydrate repair Nnr-like enzyme with NAD(P)H-hydrate dehydratase domain
MGFRGRKFENDRLSLHYDVIVVMKGAPTHIMPKSVQEYYEMALATAGSGDVLTGIITSLLAQSHEPVDAAVFCAYLRTSG